jgi:two-component system, response regulator YesN
MEEPMKAIKTFLMEKKLLIRLILSYLAVGLLIIGGLTLVITSKVSDNLKEELTASTDRAIEQSYNTADILLSFTYRHFANAYSSADIQAGFYSSEFDTALMGRIGAKLSDLAVTNPMVHSVYVVNPNQRLVFSSLTTVRTFEEFYDQKMLELLANPMVYTGSIFIPRKTEFVYDTKVFSGNLISVAYMSMRDDRAISGAMVLNLDQQILQDLVMNGTDNGTKSYQSMILNRQGTVISHTDSSMMFADVSDNEAIRKILASSSNKGSIETVFKGEKHRYSYLKSDSLGWVFVGDVNYGTLLQKVNDMKRFILTATAIMLVLTLLFGIFFIRLIYSPIHRLVQNVTRAELGRAGLRTGSEYDLLSGTFRYLERRVQDLQTSMAGYQYTERREALRQLTLGGWNETELTRKLSRAGIFFREPGFQVALLRLDSYEEWAGPYSPNDISLLKYAITNIADELGAKRFPTYSFDGGEDQVVVIFNKPEGMEPELLHILRDIQENAEHYLKLSLSVAMGSYARGFQEVPGSWQTALNGSRYRMVLGPRSLIPADMEESRESVPDNVFTGLEKQITDYMKLGDLPRTTAALEEYMTVLGRISYDEMMLLLNQLLFAVSRTAKAMAAATDTGGFRPDIGVLGQQLYKFETLDQIREWLAALCESAISVRDKQSSQKNWAIVEKLKERIHEQYADSNLTVDALAEFGGLSVNYMRKVFKDIEGISINQYLTEYRFEKAKSLLLGTDLPANRIGEMVGFENTKYFYFSFKKYSGKTPDHFRKSSGE